MTAAALELVERLYRRLIEAASDWPAGDVESLTVGDLYQHLIPYRGVRGDLGVLELAQYEDALLRLLAGEGGFVRVLDDDVRRELASELTAPNPILGIYRDYASVGVEVLAAGEASEARQRDEYPPPPLMAADAVRIVSNPAKPPIPALRREPDPGDAPSAACAFCHEPLPDVEGLQFCPHCGADQSAVPCESCGAPIRAAWNFCIRCGTRRSAPSPPTS